MRLKTIFIVVLFLGSLGFIIIKLILGNTSSVAGLKIVSEPVASLYLDEKFIGKTPYDGRHPADNYILKIDPGEGTGAVSWQDKIVLTSQTLTYVKKELGTSELLTQGEIVSLEKIDSNGTQLAISSTPDAAVISIDGIEKGITPLNLPIQEGEHDVVVNSTGFIGRSVKIKAIKGFRVNVSFQLAISSDSQSLISPTPEAATPGVTNVVSPDDTKKPYVLIKETPTNFLRVRLDASLAASEVAQLKPGVKVPFLEEKSGWLKVAYEEGKEGWISSRYAQKVE